MHRLAQSAEAVRLCGVLLVLVAANCQGGGRHLVGHQRRWHAARQLLQDIQHTPLSSEWGQADRDVAYLLEPGMGIELDYWRTRNLTCSKLVDSIKNVYKSHHDAIMVAIVINNTWHFLHPDHPPFGSGPNKDDLLRANKATRHKWPDLVPSRPASACRFTCYAPMESTYRAVNHAMEAHLGGKGHPYVIPDTIFIINAADNDRRWGLQTVVPILSLQKWWQVPWWPTGNATRLSLGRIGGGLISSSVFGMEPSSDYIGHVAFRTFEAGPTMAEAQAAARSSPEAKPRGSSKSKSSKGKGKDGSGSGGSGWEALLRTMLSRPISPLVDELFTENNRMLADMDLLIPQMNHVPTHTYFAPWEQKTDLAFFSGSPFPPYYFDTHGGRYCLREYMSVLSRIFPRDLMVRLTHNIYKEMGTADELRGLYVNHTAYPAMPMEGHAAYKWLLQLDGVSASYRMAYVMGVNSAMLKSKSPYIEWFYRLLTPGAHFLEFWKDPQDPNDVIKVLAEARTAVLHDPKGVQQAIKANQQVAQRYLGLVPRLAYFRAAVTAYRSLFPDMDECIADVLKHLDVTKRTLHMPKQRQNA